ncbi:MAG: T9SS type A sorting domain-containing protein [Brumimicrobium sp.]
MKKIYLLASVLLSTSLVFGQSALRTVKDLNTVKGKVIKQAIPTQKATPIWENDFSVEADWTASTLGQGEWEFIPSSGDSPYNANFTVASPTVDNGFWMFDAYPFLSAADPTGPQTTFDMNASITIASDIDLSAEEYITVQFYQLYYAFNYDSTFIELSTDGGTTWTSRWINQDVSANEFVGALGEPSIIRENFQVSNSANVRIRFRYSSISSGSSNPNAYGAGYFWQVDDVTIYPTPDYDIARLGRVYYGSLDAFGNHVAYHMIPTNQVAPIDFGTWAENRGVESLTNVKLVATEANFGTYTGESTPITVPAGEADSLAITGASRYTPTEEGTHNIDITLEMAETDEVLGNEVFLPYEFKVGGNIYASDKAFDDATSGIVNDEIRHNHYGWGQTGYQPPQLEFGNIFSIYSPVTLNAIDFQVGDTIADGVEVVGRIYGIENNEIVPLNQVSGYTGIATYETDPHISTGVNNPGQYISLTFAEPIELGVGEYIISVSPGSNEPGFSVALAGTANGASAPSFMYLPGLDGWGAIRDIGVIRMNFDATSGIATETAQAFNLNTYPNPFNNETNVAFTLEDAADVSYTVVDLAGQVVVNGNAGKLSAGNHTISVDGSSLSNGVYFLNLNVNNGVATQKIVVQK